MRKKQKQIMFLLFQFALSVSIVDKNSQQYTYDAFTEIHSDPVFDHLEDIAEDPLGAKIIQTIALQLQGDNMNGVSRLLNDLKGDLEGKQISDDSSNNAFQAQCKMDINEYNQRIFLSVGEINDSAFKMERIDDDIGDFTHEVNLKSEQIDIFQQKDQSLRDLRLQEAASFNSRMAQLKEMVQAFEVLLPKLIKYYDHINGGSFVEESAIKESITQLIQTGGQSPFNSLLSLTTAMNPASLQTIIEKLEGIRDSLVLSIDREDEIEASAKRDSDVTLNEIFNALVNLQREKTSDEESLRQSQSNKDQQLKRQQDAQAEFEASKKGLKQRRNQCQEMQVRYEQNTLERDKQISLIKEIENIIATKLSVVQAFIQETVLNK